MLHSLSVLADPPRGSLEDRAVPRGTRETLGMTGRALTSSSPAVKLLWPSVLRSRPGEAGANGRTATFTGTDAGLYLAGQRAAPGRRGAGSDGESGRPPCAPGAQVSRAPAHLASPSALWPLPGAGFSPAGSPLRLNHFALWSPSGPASPPCSSPGLVSLCVSSALSNSSRRSLGASVSPDLPSRSWVSRRVFHACL